MMSKFKKTTIAIIVVCLILIIAVCMKVFVFGNNSNNSSDTVSRIRLNSERYINSLEKVSIANTKDSIMVTENVKWHVPEIDGATTVSFTVTIPYTITVNGVDYKGTYELGDEFSKPTDKNPKYKLTVTDLTKDGKIKILIKRKSLFSL